MNTENKTTQDVQEQIANGNFQIAVDTALEILTTDPKNVFCLSVIAQNEFNQGHLEDAVKTLKKALEIQPNELMLNRNLGMIYNRQGLFKESVSAFSHGINNNKKHPGQLLDVLLMGISLFKVDEEQGVKAIEFSFYHANNLRNAYMNKDELPLIVEASHLGNDLIRNARYKRQKESIEELALGFKEADKTRLFDFLDSFHGIQAPQYAHEMQKPTYHVFPGLEPITFYKNEQFSWVKTLEDNYQGIKGELDALYDANVEVKPYIESGASTGNEGLDVLVDSLDWSSIHLIKAGEYKNELLVKCPRIKEVLNQLPMPVLSGNGPEVFMSILKAGAEIKPHYGLSNIKLTVHFALDIPENCSIKVGNDIQNWSDGKVLVFDDSFQHSAWNRSDRDRKVLIIEVWNPDLSNLEIQGIQKIMELQYLASENVRKNSLEFIMDNIKSMP